MEFSGIKVTIFRSAKLYYSLHRAYSDHRFQLAVRHSVISAFISATVIAIKMILSCQSQFHQGVDCPTMPPPPDPKANFWPG